MDILDFITQSHEIKDDEKLFDLLRDYVKPFGFDGLIFCLMTDHPSIAESAKHGKIAGYPEDWMKHYTASDYEPIDPVRKEVLLEQQRIFTWEGIDLIRPYNKKERSILNQGSDAGLKNGVAVSLRNSHDEIVALGFASSRGGVELNPVMLSVLKLISIQFYDAYQDMKSALSVNKKMRIYLSDREREVLQWSAAGKSTPDIGTILNISESTVNFHLKQCFEKLQANSKTLAVVKAIRLGLIKLDSDFHIVPAFRQLA
jgi:DNA-binding CsgD family transcriptional regulator